jgi:YD repeat-containing protein
LFDPSPAGASTVNGLNQLVTGPGGPFAYDGRGNLTTSGAKTYTYDVWNRLTAMNGTQVTLGYDPAGRMNRVTTATGSTRFVYDGGEIQGEVDAATGALLRRYVTGAGTDEPIVWYEGAGLSDRRWLIADERGSIAARPVQIGGTALSKSEDRQEILENLR